MKNEPSADFNLNYDYLMVDQEKIAPYDHETLSSDEVAILLGRLVTNYLKTVHILKWKPSETALLAATQDPNEMASYYGGEHTVSWRKAGEIADSWLADFQDGVDMAAVLPGASPSN